MPTPRFLVVSLGNQGPFFGCLHSAGHFAITAVQRQLSPSQPQFETHRYGKKACKCSVAWPYTFMQSPTMMNNCGPWVHAAWQDLLQRHSLQPSELGLVLVHDDLESSPGTVKVRDWEVSARGHNGVKSVKGSTDHLKHSKERWARVTVGIGRPVERDTGAVSEYVLRKLTSHQLGVINNVSGPKVVNALRRLHDEWAAS